ncbi:MAG TPA: hypothetical protein VKW08_19710 [Xanthobacteraceae bacterium]|jgi:hypothetical protein|nr:hypothetical protein [Xanthobacteraceae bacterium]
MANYLLPLPFALLGIVSLVRLGFRRGSGGRNRFAAAPHAGSA